MLRRRNRQQTCQFNLTPHAETACRPSPYLRRGNRTHGLRIPKNCNGRKTAKHRAVFAVLALLIVIGVGAFIFSGRAPANFQKGTVVTIPSGTSTREAANILASANVVRSASMFQAVVTSLMNRRGVIAGDFQFDEKLNVIGVARMLTRGDFGGTQSKITIPEGSSNAEIAKIISQAIPGWNTDEFIAKTKTKEGYLFPETYIVFKSITVDQMINMLESQYEKKVAPLRTEIAVSGKTEKEIIIMASLLEKEAKNAEEAKIVSGVLWTRIRAGLPLQVDAPFLYILGKTSAQLKISDLQKDGPYNTYTRKGLPVGPIGNPGIEMIKAAIYPQTSPYLYYLHGNDGVIRYAKTYTEHLANKKNFLK